MKLANKTNLSKLRPYQGGRPHQRGIALEIAVLTIALIGIFLFATLPSAAVRRASQPVDHLSAKIDTFSAQVERGLRSFYR